MRRTVILFVRLPRLGAGKRRLARDIGVVAALRFERLMLARALRRLGRDRRWKLRLAVTPDHAAGRWPGRLDVVPQGRGDLGERMRRALAGCPPGPVVLVGSDIPGLSATRIAEAFALLGRHDIVFGPASDGGFWLVGRRHLPPRFGRVRWSSPHVLEDTLANLPRGAVDRVCCAPRRCRRWRRLPPTRRATQLMMPGLLVLRWDITYKAKVEFDWDPQKAASNLAKHRVDFAEAIGVFDDLHQWTLVDPRIVTETRYRSIGLVNGMVLFVVYTLRGDVRRVISARRASRRERAIYTLQTGHRS